ncbi:MAG: hypothetical protein ACR2PF_21225 [Rhizobiaceae bacterium]
MLDFSLGFAGTCLAAASAYLPWHVYLYSSSFQPPQMTFSGTAAQTADIDLIVTGSTQEIAVPLFQNATQQTRSGVLSRSPLSDKKKASTYGTTNPYPGDLLDGDKLVYRVLFATPGRALLGTGGDVIAVYPGARLPDGSIVKTVSNSDGLWQVVDSSGRIFR